MAAYVNDPDSETFSQAGDVEAQLQNFHMLEGLGVPRHDRFMIFIISRELWAPSATMAFCDVLCSAAGQQAPTPADALELLGRMAPWYKATMWETEDNELVRFAPKLIANTLDLPARVRALGSHMDDLKRVAAFVTSNDDVLTDRGAFDKAVALLKKAETGHGDYGAAHAMRQWNYMNGYNVPGDGLLPMGSGAQIPNMPSTGAGIEALHDLGFPELAKLDPGEFAFVACMCGKEPRAHIDLNGATVATWAALIRSHGKSPTTSSSANVYNAHPTTHTTPPDARGASDAPGTSPPAHPPRRVPTSPLPPTFSPPPPPTLSPPLPATSPTTAPPPPPRGHAKKRELDGEKQKKLKRQRITGALEETMAQRAPPASASSDDKAGGGITRIMATSQRTASGMTVYKGKGPNGQGEEALDSAWVHRNIQKWFLQSVVWPELDKWHKVPLGSAASDSASAAGGASGGGLLSMAVPFADGSVVDESPPLVPFTQGKEDTCYPCAGANALESAGDHDGAARVAAEKMEPRVRRRQEPARPARSSSSRAKRLELRARQREETRGTRTRRPTRTARGSCRT